jgi:PIN domain nuclease of toxin-antitoxin system
VWLVEGHQGLKQRAVSMMERAGEDSRLRLCAISVWEVAMLESKGRIGFNVPCLEWIEAALGLPGLSLMPLTPVICVESTRLPGALAGDPADRLIVATARGLGATLITRDERLLRYARTGSVKAVEV